MSTALLRWAIAREDGQFLHYIGGTLFWHKPSNFDDVIDSTLRRTKKEATEFALRVRGEGRCPWELHAVPVSLNIGRGK